MWGNVEWIQHNVFSGLDWAGKYLVKLFGESLITTYSDEKLSAAQDDFCHVSVFVCLQNEPVMNKSKWGSFLLFLSAKKKNWCTNKEEVIKKQEY